MQLLGTDPLNPAAKALQNNMNPAALIKFVGSRIEAVRTYLTNILKPSNASQKAFFLKWFPVELNDLIWSLEMVDTVIGPENYRTSYRSSAALNDSNMDVLYEDMSKATTISDAQIAQTVSTAFKSWNDAKSGRPAGSALVTVNESKIMAGTLSDTFAANRDFKTSTGIISATERASRAELVRKLAPGIKPADTTLQYATGGGGIKSTGIINPMESPLDGPATPKKAINPLVLAGVAVAGYFAYKSLA